MTTTPKVILIILTVVATLGMGLFVIKQRRDPPNAAFFLMCLAAALQSIFLLGREWMLDQNLVPLPWNNLADAVGPVFSFAAVSFALSFPQPIAIAKRVLLPLAACSLIIAVIALNGGNFSDHRVVNHIHLVEKTWFFNVYMSYVVCSLVAVIGILLYKYRCMRSTRENERARKILGTTLIGFFVATAVGLFFIFVKPILMHDLRQFYLQTLGFLIGTSVIFYSIVRYNAFDIETVLHKTLSWTFLSSGPLVAAIWAGFWLKPRLAEAPAWQWAMVIGGIGFVSGLYLYMAQPYIDQLFDRRKYDLRKALDAVISDLAVLQEILPMARGILERVCQVLFVDDASAMVLDDYGEHLLTVASHGCRVRDSQAVDPAVLKQLRSGSVLTWDQERMNLPMETDPVQVWLKERSLAICVPLSRRGELIGAIGLGRKRNLRSFSQREIEFLTQICAAATIAFSNSLLLERVRDLDRLKTEFLSEVAHELRGPLSGISSIAEGILAISAGSMSEEHRRLIKNIQVTGLEMKDLVEHLLDLSKIEMGVMTYDFRPVDVAAVIRLVVDLARKAIGAKGLDMALDVEDNLPMIQGDKARIRQCVSNLLSNAIKYTNQGKILISCHAEGEGIRVDVQDTGRGMTEEELNTVFEKYRRGARTEAIEGSGLGLALTKEIVQSHGGRIEVASKVGIGSTFSLHLPKTAAPDAGRSVAFINPTGHLLQGPRIIEASSKNAVSSDALMGNGEMLVVIDDSDVDRELLRTALVARGYRVLTAKDGLEGLELVRSMRPGLVVTDLIMPRLSGAELCGLLKEDPSTASIPVVLMTARSSLGDMVFGIQMGADDYIAKPYDIDLLCLRIAALLRMWRIRSDLQAAQARLDEMELIATSAGTLVHSIKNPLVVIRNYVKWVRDSLERSESASVYKGLEKIDSSAAAIARIIDGLRRAHIEPPKMSWVQLQGLLDASFSEVSAAVPSSQINVIREYENGLSHVEGDMHQLRMAFMNLLVNALEAMPEGGTLALRVYAADSNGIQVEIEDSGSGIREDIKGSLFKPFVTTKPHGSGLGLWTAKRIIETNHHGRLKIESLPEKGTIVKAWLPAGRHPKKAVREVLQHG